jgi:hypothetical protein
MKSDKAIHDIPRHITYQLRTSLPAFFSQGKLCTQTEVKHITNGGTSRFRFSAFVTYEKKCGVAMCQYAALQTLQKPYNLVGREKGVKEG